MICAAADSQGSAKALVVGPPAFVPFLLAQVDREGHAGISTQRDAAIDQCDGGTILPEFQAGAEAQFAKVAVERIVDDPGGGREGITLGGQANTDHVAGNGIDACAKYNPLMRPLPASTGENPRTSSAP